MASNEISTADPDRAVTLHSLSVPPRLHRIFAGLTQDQVERLLRSGRIESVNAGQLLYSRGDVFAEAVAFMERPVYQMTATAATAARVMSFPNQVYIEILRENAAARPHPGNRRHRPRDPARNSPPGWRSSRRHCRGHCERSRTAARSS